MAIARRMSVATVFALLFVLVALGQSEAQNLPAANADVKAVQGRAEVLRGGQTSWSALASGARLAEGDQVRTGPGGSIEFALPDGSSTLVAENTRYVITKLQYSPQNRQRNFGFHIVVGKVKNEVSRAAVEAVRARQANFFISTPNGVAAARGTLVVILFNPATGQSLTAVLPSPGQLAGQAIVTHISLSTGTVTTITGGNFVTQVAGQPPSAAASIGTLPSNVQTILLTAANSATAGSPLLVAVDIEIPILPPALLGEAFTPTTPIEFTTPSTPRPES
ncbi:MAG: FecR domain-containing protein [Candidatus Rokubacteria bacterium]|nr:FecR domain-containing protein [Candidatus Rokubacteria bacterium]